MTPYRAPEPAAADAVSADAVDYDRFRPRSVAMNAAGLLGLLVAAISVLIWILNQRRGSTGLGLLVAMLVGALAILAWAIKRVRLLMTLVRDNLEGVRAQQHGRWQDAASVFDALLDRARPHPRVHAVIAMNRAVCMLNARQGESALRIFRALEKHGSISRKRSPTRGAFFRNMAITLTILGQLDEAESYLRRAIEAMVPSARADLVLVESMLAARRERHADVLARTGSSEALHGMQARILRILRAFALEKSPAPDQAEIDMLLAGARPCRLGELDYYAVTWPEFRAYLVKHGFSAA